MLRGRNLGVQQTLRTLDKLHAEPGGKLYGNRKQVARFEADMKSVEKVAGSSAPIAVENIHLARITARAGGSRKAVMISAPRRGYGGAHYGFADQLAKGMTR